MEISSRNALKGTVKQIVPGPVNTEVLLEVAPGIEVVAVIAESLAQEMGLAEGQQVYALVQATDVMVGVPSL